MSCMRFPMRKPLMSFAIILNMFPGVLSMIAIFFVMKLIGLTDSMLGLIIIYSAGSGLGYLICKGIFDTIPASLRESATLEGASQLCIFTRIVIPLSKPIIVYTVINSFPDTMDGFCYGEADDPFQESYRLDSCHGAFNLVQRTLVGDYFCILCRRYYCSNSNLHSVSADAEVLC